MTFLLPDRMSKKWSQTNNSDRFGTVFMSRNIDFDEEGYLKLSKRSRSIYDTDQDANFVNIAAIAYDSGADRYYVVTEDNIFYVNNVLQTVTDDANANVPTTLNTGSDAVIFAGNLYVSAGITDGLRRWTGSAWSTQLYALTVDVAPMAVFENKVNLAIGQGNTVLLLNTSHSLVQTLTIPSQYSVTSLDWANNRLYVGTRHNDNGEAILFEWDGSGTSANNGYPCGSVRIDSVKRYKNSVVIYTGEGQLLYFNGGGFDVLANFPPYYSNLKFSPAGNVAAGSTSHRGMVVVGDTILVNVRATLRTSSDDQTEAAFINSFPGGIWCFDPEVGLYHKHSISANMRLISSAVATTDVNTTTDVITIGGQTVPETGTPVLYDDGANGAGTAIGGLVHRTKYYVIYQSDTTMKLATTRALADAGTAINLTGTGNNAQFFVFVPNRDYGGDRTVQGTALCVINSDDPIRSDGMSLMFGATIGKTTGATTKHVLNVIADKQENRGVMVTPHIGAEGLTDKFSRIAVRFKNVRTAEDKIIVKYRMAERDDRLKYIDINRTLTATFTDGNTFTTTATAFSAAKVGDEVTFHAGTGMGYTAHITAISENAGTYTVDIDETIRNLAGSDTALFTVDNWQKLRTITVSDVLTFTNDNGDNYSASNGVVDDIKIDKSAPWIQLKLELRGQDVAIEDILINSKPYRSLIV